MRGGFPFVTVIGSSVAPQGASNVTSTRSVGTVLYRLSRAVKAFPGVPKGGVAI